MAEDFSKPINTTTYLDILTYLRDNIDLLATMFKDPSSASNIPTDSIQFDTTDRQFKKWTGTAWAELLEVATATPTTHQYDILVSKANLATTTGVSCTGSTTGKAATAGTADVATGLDVSGVTKTGDKFHLLSTLLPTTSGGTGVGSIASMISTNEILTDTAAEAKYFIKASLFSELGGGGTEDAGTARTNLGVYSTTEVDAAIAVSRVIIYATTPYTLAVSQNTTINAPAGYAYCDWSLAVGTDITFPTFVSLNTAGTSLILNNASATVTPSVIVVWKKIT